MAIHSLTKTGIGSSSHNAYSCSSEIAQLESPCADQVGERLSRAGRVGKGGNGSPACGTRSTEREGCCQTIRPMSDSGPGNGSRGCRAIGEAQAKSASGRRVAKSLILKDATPFLTPKSRPEKAHDCAQEPTEAEFWRGHMLTCHRIREVAVQLRAERTKAGADLRERLAHASVIDTVDEWIANARRRLVLAQRVTP